jgi:2-aminoethylphosphonate-pyruvate transaminase
MIIHRDRDKDYPIRLTPGPFEVSPEVMLAGIKGIAGHRSNIFKRLLRENADKIIEVYEIEKKEEYYPVVITGSGTSAMESMVAATVQSSKPLVIVNGRFSQRLADISKIYNINTKILSFKNGDPIDINQVESFILKNKELTQLLFCIQDTREGILNPYINLCSIAKKSGMLLCVDGISSMIFENVKPHIRDIDFFTDSSGKGIRSLPGLGIICGKINEFEKLSALKIKTYYLNLFNHFKIQKYAHEPLFAPAVSLHYSLGTALDELLSEGVETRRNNIIAFSSIVRDFISEIGLKLLHSNLNENPNSITSIMLPERVKFKQFQEKVQEKGFLIYSGSSVYEDCFQIGTGGYLDEQIILEGLMAIKETIYELT